MQKLQLVAGIFCLAILLTSCARTYHPELVGHYKPNTEVAKNQATPPLSHPNNNIQPLSVKNDNEGVASATETQPDLKLQQSRLQQSSSNSITEKQQQKFEKKLEKVRVKVENRAAQSGKQIQQQARSNDNSVKRSGSHNGDQLLCAIISIFIPPLGVILYEEDITVHFWIDLLLTILFYLPGLIYALIIILGGVHHD
ncbi:MAG TPA: YqaE/Pmp3 family membrane protein [Chitinophagales bacterium]|nr:YqaE/Pmp3 family membrane protein [Chitinophagales bacterium]